jgi:hypothetical protein
MYTEIEGIESRECSCVDRWKVYIDEGGRKGEE